MSFCAQPSFLSSLFSAAFLSFPFLFTSHLPHFHAWNLSSSHAPHIRITNPLSATSPPHLHLPQPHLGLTTGCVPPPSLTPPNHLPTTPSPLMSGEPVGIPELLLIIAFTGIPHCLALPWGGKARQKVKQ